MLSNGETDCGNLCLCQRVERMVEFSGLRYSSTVHSMSIGRCMTIDAVSMANIELALDGVNHA